MSEAHGFIKFSRCDECEYCYGAHSPECPTLIDAIVDKVTSGFRRELQSITAGKPMLCMITGQPVEPWALQAMERSKFKPCECPGCRVPAIKGDSV